MSPHPTPMAHRRQTPPPAPTNNGISNAGTTVNTNDAATLGQATLDTALSGVAATDSAPGIVQGSTLVVTQTDADAAPTTAPAAASPTSSSSSSSSDIPMGTVIGACVGAVVALILIVVFAVWFNRRLSRPVPKRRGTPLTPISHKRNESGEARRRRSKLEPWTKFGEGGDTWEGKGDLKVAQIQNVGPTTKEVDAIGFGGMFKKTPSMRSGPDEKDITSDGGHGEMPQLAKYHPQLAEELSRQPQERHFLGRVDTGEPLSWDGETVGDESFLSLRNSNLSKTSSGAMSPTLAVLRNTPAAVSQTHRWESAEVVNYDSTSTSENPFAQDEEPLERRKSRGNNPFFSAQDPFAGNRGRRSRSNSRSSRPGSVSSRRGSVSSHTTAKNPFHDDAAPPVPGTLAAHANSDSTASNAAALQSLIAALDVQPERDSASGPQRVSAQGSMWSQASGYTDLTYQDEPETVEQFPLPPGGALHQR